MKNFQMIIEKHYNRMLRIYKVCEKKYTHKKGPN